MSVEASDAIVVFITAASDEEATRLAEILVKTDLAACVQILPSIQSVYRWKGKLERQSEVLLVAKTLRSRFEALDCELRAIHSYEVPEIVAVPLTAISQPYLDWLVDAIGLSPETD